MTRKILSLLLAFVMTLTMFAGFTVASNAVFSGTGSFVKTTGTLESGYYVFVYGTNAANNANSTNNWLTFTNVTISNDVITNPAADIVWYYDKDAGTLQSYGDNTKYLKWPTTGNTATAGNPATTISISETSTAGVYHISADNGGRVLRFNATGWRFYASNSTAGSADIAFYKYTEGGHTHIPDQVNYHTDGTYHWRVCTETDCTETDNKYDIGEHTSSGGGTVTTAPDCIHAGEETRTCSVCGASYTVSVPATGVHVDEDKDGICDVEGCGASMTVLTFKVNGVVDDSLKITGNDGESVTLPTPDVGSLKDCEHTYSFIGWAVLSDDISTPVTTLSEGTSIGSYTLAGNTNFTAVYGYSMGDNSYTLVESVDDLVIGSSVIIVAKDSNQSLSKTQSSNNRSAVEGTKSDDGKVFTPNANTAILTLGEGTVSDPDETVSPYTYSFFDSSSENKGYLYAASDSKNYLRTQSTNDANGSFTIAINDGVATLTAQGGNSHNLLKYNSGNNLFSCYASGQNDVSLYQKRPGTTYYLTAATATIGVYDGVVPAPYNNPDTGETEDSITIVGSIAGITEGNIGDYQEITMDAVFSKVGSTKTKTFNDVKFNSIYTTIGGIATTSESVYEASGGTIALVPNADYLFALRLHGNIAPDSGVDEYSVEVTVTLVPKTGDPIVAVKTITFPVASDSFT